MAWDRYETSYHLTPNGWVIADEAPPGTVVTKTLHVEQASGWSKEHRSWSTVENPDTLETERKELERKFGSNPKNA